MLRIVQPRLKGPPSGVGPRAPIGAACLLLVLLALGCGGPTGANGDGSGATPSATDAPPASAASASASAAGGPAPPPFASAPPFTSSERFDLVIRAGLVVDGSGAAATVADVLVRGDTIVHVGQVDASVHTREAIDAKGRVVAPGFIDTHAHGDPTEASRNYLAQGVTTLCLGQDGTSAGGDRVATWVKRHQKKRLALNAAPFVGHGTVRNAAGVGLAKRPTDPQIEKMASLVERDMKAGAFGLTTGLEYQPGSFATAAELVAIARPVAAAGGVVMSHLRSEDDDKIDAALDELLLQGRGSGARVHFSHAKIVYGKGAARAEALLAKLAAARAAGLGVTADIYPYEASYTGIGIVFPDFAKPPHSYTRVKRERHDELARWLRERVALRGGPEATLFGTAPYTGKTLAELAKQYGKPFEEVLIGIGPGGAQAAYFVMDEAVQARLLADPFFMISTDGGPRSRHPRAYGAFSRVLSVYVKEKKVLGLEEAVRKMSGLPAETLGLERRGLVRAGWAADLVVFDPARVRDRATYTEPNLLTEGMDYVLVNGEAVVAGGEPTKARPGRVLLHGDGTRPVPPAPR
ncbi:MAG: amidohydrolase family protein [Myxococcales bacterium]|nr:amidohydrolase family protein [Myxococcales bacterium]